MASSEKKVDREERKASMDRSLVYESLGIAVFVIGTALVLFIAVTNSLTWHMQTIWGASGNFWQEHWNMVDDWFDADYFTMFTLGGGLVTMGVYIPLNLCLIVLDVYEWPQSLYQYKVQPAEHLNMAQFWKTVKRVAFNQVVIGYMVMVVFYYLSRLRVGNIFDRELPSFQKALIHLLLFVVIEEIGFYYTHRLAHHPRLYKHIHKIHHEWTAPIGIVSLYAHPIEHIVSNMSPVLLGPLLLGSHIAIGWLWIILALITTTLTHSGYHFPLMVSPESHDYHHLKFTQNFGVLGVLDRLHGTDSLYRQSKQYERHTMLLSLKPARLLIPDQPKLDAKQK